jgi:hypothetical protein
MDDAEIIPIRLLGNGLGRDQRPKPEDHAFWLLCIPAKMLSFTPTLVIWGMSLDEQGRECGLAYPNARKMKGIWRMRPNL